MGFWILDCSSFRRSSVETQPQTLQRRLGLGWPRDIWDVCGLATAQTLRPYVPYTLALAALANACRLPNGINQAVLLNWTVRSFIWIQA